MRINKNAIIGAGLFIVVGSLIVWLTQREPISKKENNIISENNTEETISQTGIDKTTITLYTPPHNGEINFFLENSGSMDGYLNDNTEFKSSINLILKNLELEDYNVNTFYVNSLVYSSNVDLDRFISEVNNGVNCEKGVDFRVGDRSTSNINLMFSKAIDATKEGGVSILVSDGIYSLETTNLSEIRDALETEKLKTRNELVKVIESGNLMTVVLKLTSKFNGTYYTANGNSVSINQNRPYYIWIFGTPEQVETTLKSISINTLPGYQKQAKFFRTNDLDVPYSILTTGEEKTGAFQKENHTAELVHGIKNAEKSNRSNEKGIFSFGVAVDLNSLFLDEAYILDEENYKIEGSNESYKLIDIKPKAQFGKSSKLSIQNLGNFNPTHILVLKSNASFLGKVDIKLSNNTPSWIEETNSFDDSQIKSDQTKTFGYAALMEGISLAYDHLNETDYYLKLPIIINH